MFKVIKFSFDNNIDVYTLYYVFSNLFNFQG